MKIQFGSENPIEWRPWMIEGGISLLMFALSYLLAATMPDCPNCATHGDASAMQVFHFFFWVIFGISSVGFLYSAVIHFFEEWPR